MNATHHFAPPRLVLPVAWRSGALLLLAGVTGCGTLVISKPAPADRPASQLTYALPKVLFQFAATNDAKQGTLLDIRPLPAIADPSAVYELHLPHRAWRSDDFSVQLTPNGVLASLSLTNEDATPQIVAELGQLAVEAAKAVVMFREPAVRAQAFSLVFDVGNLPKANAWLAANRQPFRLRVEGVPPQVTTFSRTQTVAGVICRRSTLVWVEVLAATDQTVLLQAPVLVPNFGPEFVVPLKAGAGVKRGFSLTFDNGILTQMSASRPSELLGWVSPLITVPKAIVSIPGELLTLRVNHAGKESQLLQHQQAILQAQKDLLKLQQELKSSGNGR
jgi:hypothetical protein